MKNKITFKSFSLFSVCLIAFVWLNTMNAQDTNVYELFENDFQLDKVQAKSQTKSATLKSGVNNKEVTNINLQDFLKLNNNIQPTVYIDKNAVVNVTGAVSPVKVKYSNIKPFNKLNEEESLFNSVELVVINLKTSNDLKNEFDLSKVNQYHNLKYIFIKCHFNCSVNQIQQFVKNTEPEVIVYFTKVNPS